MIVGLCIVFAILDCCGDVFVIILPLIKFVYTKVTCYFYALRSLFAKVSSVAIATFNQFECCTV